MIKFLKKYFWTIFIIISSFGLAGSAAYFSISGLSKLFAGSALQIIIMASFIEFAKITTTAALHRFWKSVSLALKIPLIIMIIVIMGITSSGIYGFLADAYSSTSIQLEKIEGQIGLINKQIEQKKNQIIGIEELKEMKTNRINSLTNLRLQQEIRLDSLYNKGWSHSAKQTQKLIDEASIEIHNIQNEVDSFVGKIQIINEDIGEFDIQVLDLQNTDVATEIGPLKYMSKVIDKPIESIINWFILTIMIAFDPLAILLVIFANVVYDRVNESNNGSAPPKDDEPNPKIELDKSEVDDNQKIIDEVNNVDSKIKKDEVFEYIEGKGGNFEKSKDTKESISSIINGIDPNPIYTKLLEVFYLDGQRKVGDTIPPYEVFLKDIKNRNIDCPEKIVKNFLTISNLLGIVNMIDKNNVIIMKDYKASKQIISLVSK